MKICTFFLLILLFSCQNQSSPTSISERDIIPQWTILKGDADMPSIVFVSGDEEYRSEEALPQLAKILNTHYGYNCTVLFAQDPDQPGIVNPNYTRNIPGLHFLKDADLMFIFTRFRALPDDQMDHIDRYLKEGKPVIGIRTSTHAFNFTKDDSLSNFKHYGNNYKVEGPWKDGFGRLVLGEKWISHHGHHRHQSTRGIIAPGSRNNPIVNGIKNGAIWGATDVYGVRLPLPDDSNPIILGQVVDREGAYAEDDLLYGLKESDRTVAGVDTSRLSLGSLNDPMMPIAWTKSYQLPGGASGKAFTSTIGASTDLMNESVRRLLVNAVFWSLDLDVPPSANVAFVGNYNPTPFRFVDDQYWIDLNVKIQDF